MRTLICRLALLLALMLFIHSGALAELDELQGMLDALNDGAAVDAPEEGAQPSELEELQGMLEELNDGAVVDAPGEGAQPSELEVLQSMLNALGANETMPEPDEPTDVNAEIPQEEVPSLDPNYSVNESQPKETEEAEKPEAAPTEEAPAGDGRVSQSDYALLDGFDLTSLNDTVAVQIPSGWGNDVGISETMVSYAPGNGSGVADPSSSTLSTIWSGEKTNGVDQLEQYVDNIRKSYIYSDVTAEPSTVAGQAGMSLTYVMDLGINSFQCKSACFVYDDILYGVEMMQGDQSAQDYFPVYETVIGSEAIMDGKWELSQPSAVETPVPTAVPTAPQQVTSAPEPTAEPRQESNTVTAQANDLGGFTYSINGHPYQFPTDMGVIAEGDLQIDNTLVLSCERDTKGEGSELANTLYFMLAAYPGRELIGVTNRTGKNVPMTEGVLTALVDSQADVIDVELPGGIRIGSTEDSIAAAFPEFQGRSMDGLAGFRDNELLYACNVRDDGCNGYVIIRNDAPYCSTLSIICENGVIREINYQCLGATVANSIFES